MPRPAILTLLPVLAMAAGPTSAAFAAAPAATASTLFEDITASAGITFVHDDGGSGKLHLPEVMGPGCALFDMDGDGDLDAYLVQGGRIADGRIDPAAGGGRLYRNDLKVGPDGQAGASSTSPT